MFKNLRDLMSISRPTSPQRSKRKPSKLSFEALEPRKMMATVSVFAAGETGDESFNLIINNQLVETFDDVGGDTETRDFQQFTVHTDSPVSADQVQVEFINDTANGDYDRNLLIDKIVVDGQAFQTEADSTLSTGLIKDDGSFSGEGFFETELLNVNGTFSFLQDNGEQNAGTRIRIDAMGDTGEENLQVRINGEIVKNFRFDNQQADTMESFQFVVNDTVDIEDISIRFTNDFNDSHLDRNLTIRSYQVIDLETGSRQIARPTDANVFSTGVYTDADGIQSGFGRGNTLATNGFFEVREEVTQETPTRLRIDASGETGDEVMEVFLKDNLIGRFEVGTATQAYFINIDHDFALSDIKISFVNDASDDHGYDRNLTVNAFQKIGEDGQRTIARPTDANVFSTGSFLDGDGIVSGFGRGKTLNANGFFQLRDTVTNDDSYSVDRRISNDAYFVKTDSHSGNFIAAYGTNLNNLFGHRLILFNAQGNRVTEFGTNGIVQWTDVADAGGFGFTRIEDIDFMRDGSVIITAHRVPESGRTLPYIIKLQSNGEVDSSFAINGLVRNTPVGFTIGDGFSRLVTLPETDGHITLIGAAANSGNDIALSHYDEFGQLDPIYGNNGNVVIPGEVLSGQTLDSNDRVSLIGAVALEDNSVLLVNSISANDLKITVLKLDHLGAIDRSYGDNGLATVDTTGFGFFGRDVIVDSQNRLVLTSSNAVKRLNTDGSMDASFGDNGTASLPAVPDADAAFLVNFVPIKITVDSQDRIVIIGNRNEVSGPRGPSGNDGSYIYRLDLSGSLDNSFDGDGIQYFENLRVGSSQALVDVPFSVALDAQDNLITGVSDSGEDRGAVSLSRFKLG